MFRRCLLRRVTTVGPPKFTTPDLCDYAESKGIKVRVLEPMFRNFGGRTTFHGKVTTIKCFEDNSLVKEQASLPGNGHVLVVDGGGSKRRALLGDMIAQKAVQSEWAGFVIFGCVRDVDILATLPLGVQALAPFPVKTEKRGLGDLNREITFGGTTIVPGEYIYADNNGIVVAEEPLVLL